MNNQPSTFKNLKSIRRTTKMQRSIYLDQIPARRAAFARRRAALVFVAWSRHLEFTNTQDCDTGNSGKVGSDARGLGTIMWHRVKRERPGHYNAPRWRLFHRKSIIAREHTPTPWPITHLISKLPDYLNDLSLPILFYYVRGFFVNRSEFSGESWVFWTRSEKPDHEI